MQPSEQDLQAHFADLSDEALLRSAAAANELTPLALDVLRAEVTSRRLAMPSNESHEAEPPSWDDQKIVSIRRFRDFSEAMVARAALEGSSIPCFLRNENTVRIDWQISNAIGGIRLDVLESDVDAAEAVLLPMDTDTTDVVVSELVCPKCGSQEIHRKHRWGGLDVASIMTPGFSLQREQKGWICDACDAHWSEDEAD